MSRPRHTSRSQPWLESLGDWAWPGRAAPADATPLPPPWVPAFPPRLEPAIAAYAPAPVSRRRRATPRQLLLAALLSALAGVCSALALKGSFGLEAILGARAPSRPPPPTRARSDPSIAAKPLPSLASVSRDPAGSTVASASFGSQALAGKGSFIVYLPPGYSSSTLRYPVLYLLHGRDGHANAFLEIGIQKTLDRLIDGGAIAPMIAVMIQDRGGPNNWRNVGRFQSETYVVEVQELIDRMLRTIPTRAGRAIAGSSMGGFGAMHVALANPIRFSVVESWLGFFDGLGGELRADEPVLKRLGLHAFLYGAEADPVAVPQEDPAFAAELRAVGAQAQGVIYTGGHSLEKVRQHLDTGLLFAGRSLADAQRRADAEQARRGGAAIMELGAGQLGATP